MKLEVLSLDKTAYSYGHQFIEEHILPSVARAAGWNEELQALMMSFSETQGLISEDNDWPLLMNDIADENSMLEFAILGHDSREDTYYIEFVGRIKG